MASASSNHPGVEEAATPRSTFGSDVHGRANYAGGSANLEARAALWTFAVRERPLDWFCELVDWNDVCLAVDVGTGSGRFLPALADRADRVVALDLSTGMLEEVAARESAPPLVNGDVCAIPLRDGCADRVLAAWMLYHAADVDMACSELRRLLAPDGALIAVTNAAGHTAELDQLYSEAMVSLTGAAPSVGFPSNGFSLDEAAMALTRHFGSVEMHPRRVVLRVPEVPPILAYLGSLRSYIDDALEGHGASFEDLMPHIEAIAAERIAARGAFEVTGLPTAIVCR